METSLSKHWHHLPIEEVLDLLDADQQKGLDKFEIQDRQAKYGRNVITPRKGHGPLVRFLLQFHQPLIYILLAAAAITAFFHEWVDSGVIFAVVLVNALVGFIQEAKALKAIEALKSMMSSEAVVMREGVKKRVLSSELVPGDIVLLQSGDKVPADLRLLRLRELQIDESALTGESVPVQKNAASISHDAVLADRKNMAYSGTLATYGIGVGCVIAIGDSTEIGKISEMISSTKVLETPLTLKISQFSKTLLYVILAMAGVTFLIGTIRGEPWFDMFMAAVALAVGAIPEGLPAAVTIMLAIGVSRMAKRHAIIRKLPAVETLGSTTVICSDKTGTLTQNQMTVQEICVGSEIYQVSGIGYAPEGEIRLGANRIEIPSSGRSALMECLKAGLLCNDASLCKVENGWRIEGDPTEGALLVSALKAGLVQDICHKECSRVDSIPFESEHQYMGTLHKTADDRMSIAYLKGSVESLLSRCQTMMNAQGEEVAINEKNIYAQIDALGAKGLRVLGFARKSFPSTKESITHEDVGSGLIFLGMQGMIDPPRKEAIEAIKACHHAGIKVKMITGDHAGTAAAIAKQIGLLNENEDGQGVLTGKEIAQMLDHDLIAAVESASVFARVAPEQKLRLVEALQDLGHVVAMTGDGVNDAPALRRANIGIAMGITGTEVSKEAADMILTNDNFASIEAAVEEGRGVFDNLVKFIAWTLPTNVGEGLVLMAAVLSGTALPILPVQILYINMTTALLLGLSLAFEPKELGLMDKSPRDPETPIITRLLIVRILTVGVFMLVASFALFYFEQKNGGSLDQARTVAVNVFVMIELFYLFNCRSLEKSAFKIGVLSNPWTIIGAGFMIVLQLFLTYNPIMNRFFHTAPITLTSWLWVFGAAFSLYCIVGIEKMLRRRSLEAATHGEKS